MQDLSDNHIVEIIVRLPVKTIVHCKCICRDWLNLITDSRFINLQLAKSDESFMLFDGYTMDPTVNPKSLRLVEIQDENGRNHYATTQSQFLISTLLPFFETLNCLQRDQLMV
ncbi:putative F-box protein At3g52320 [Rutidosis leptorrhynchoides]|uniref:putative F-box protein At3g52320 n=1 Tax=Rutidosis leptorrhynchoides TaxID=125765 RepID=UPI003A99AC65